MEVLLNGLMLFILIPLYSAGMAHTLLQNILLLTFFESICNGYIVVTQSGDWNAAENYCMNNYNTHLASIHSNSENAEIYSLCNTHCWIGLNDVQSEGSWIWTDGSSNTFTNWIVVSNEPNGDGNCAHMWEQNGDVQRDSYWNDSPCTHIRGQFVCNEPILAPTNNPTLAPTNNPTPAPTNNPTPAPTNNPSKNPTTMNPTFNPSKDPTTMNPTKFPSLNPSFSPSKNPSKSPTKIPSSNPSVLPSISPSDNPTLQPSITPIGVLDNVYESKNYIGIAKLLNTDEAALFCEENFNSNLATVLQQSDETEIETQILKRMYEETRRSVVHFGYRDYNGIAKWLHGQCIATNVLQEIWHTTATSPHKMQCGYFNLLHPMHFDIGSCTLKRYFVCNNPNGKYSQPVC